MNDKSLYFAILCAAILGCSGSPPGVEPVNVDASNAAQKALDDYDRDGNGALSEQELQAVPAILAAKQLYDADGDGKITQQEIESRIDKWHEQKLGFRPMRVKVLWKGRPLVGARVEFCTPRGILIGRTLSGDFWQGRRAERPKNKVFSATIAAKIRRISANCLQMRRAETIVFPGNSRGRFCAERACNIQNSRARVAKELRNCDRVYTIPQRVAFASEFREIQRRLA